VEETLAVGLALGAGVALQAAVGFGAGLLAAPLLALVLDPVEVVWLLLLSALVFGPLILAEPGGRGRVAWKDVALLVVFALPLMPLGAIVVHALGASAMQVLVGCAVLAALGLQWLRPPAEATAAGRALAGAAAGFMTTSTSLNGPPLVLWLRRRHEDAAAFRATVTAVFLALDGIGLAVLLAGGLPDLSAAELGAGLVGTLAGWALGRGLFARLRPEQHRAAVTAVLVGAALTSLAAGLA
jgi:uncharacterized membrane protein YfcA